MRNTDLCFLTATDFARRIRSREFSCREVMETHLAQIERVNPKVNAIATLSGRYGTLCAQAILTASVR